MSIVKVWLVGLKQQEHGVAVQRPLGLQMSSKVRGSALGFTIVELLIVVVVIAILAAITIVAYSGITAQARDSSLKADLANGAKQLHLVKVESGSFPYASPALSSSEGVKLVYIGGGSSFCLQATSSTGVFHITQAGSMQEGECSPLYMQTVTRESCPAERTVAVDARDKHTYYIQKLADGQCWMLINLAYSGGTSNGGTDIYGDTVSTATLLNGSSNSETTYTEARYYIHQYANPTVYPEAPATRTFPGSSYVQYSFGYHYNWCAAMGAQVGTSACANTSTPASDPSVSICPAGWRLPTGQATTGEYTLLVNSVGNGQPNAYPGLRSAWLSEPANAWVSEFKSAQASSGYYWSSTQNNASGVRILYFNGSGYPTPDYPASKPQGRSVRCLAT